ncbi:MAG TPA: hypothetical protein VMU92_02040 [Acidobacteriaceae bacterium]|nr:hypothetical protein [Acidobacteriaceae bacterium]
MRPRFFISLALALCLTATGVFASDHKMPVPKDASTYPSYDSHSNEHVVIAAIPYDTKKMGKIFRVHYTENNFMPIYIVVTNNGDKTISLDQARIDFIDAAGDRIPAAQPEDVERRMTHITGPGKMIPLPEPLPPIRRKPHSPDKKIEADFNQFEYSAITVPPHSTRAGFLFYDMQGLGHTPLKGASLVLRDLRTASGQELFYFQIPLDKYL